MRAIRLAIAALIALALAVAPISAGFAKPTAAKTEMGMSMPDADCPCCDTQRDPSADVCPLKCCSAAVLAEALPLAGPRAAGTVDTVAAVLAPFSPPPDPPPPRS